jgi:hypothetical protein
MKNVNNTAILKNAECVDCGWAIIDICCNGQDEPFALWDWWWYCSNKSCKNHFGEGVFQNIPDFVKYEEN